jgi:hypothetical protein
VAASTFVFVDLSGWNLALNIVAVLQDSRFRVCLPTTAGRPGMTGFGIVSSVGNGMVGAEARVALLFGVSRPAWIACLRQRFGSL